MDPLQQFKFNLYYQYYVIYMCVSMYRSVLYEYIYCVCTVQCTQYSIQVQMVFNCYNSVKVILLRWALGMHFFLDVLLLFVHFKKDPQRFSVLCCLLAFYLAIMVSLILLAGLTSYSVKKLKNGAQPLYFTLAVKLCVCVCGRYLYLPTAQTLSSSYFWIAQICSFFCCTSILVIRSPRQ